MKLIDGINLSKPEYTKVAKVVNSVSKYMKDKKFDADKIKKEFEIYMKQEFSFDCKFEELKIKDRWNSEISGIACRFANKRPLIYCLIDEINNKYSIIDEKRFDAFDKGPFEHVNI